MLQTKTKQCDWEQRDHHPIGHTHLDWQWDKTNNLNIIIMSNTNKELILINIAISAESNAFINITEQRSEIKIN